MTVLDYARGDRPRRRLGRLLVVVVVIGGAAAAMWLAAPSPRQRPTLTRMVVYAIDEMRRTSEAAAAFRDANERLPASLEELRSSPFGSGLVPGQWERELRIVWLGERGREADILAYCFPGRVDQHGGVVLLRLDLLVESESWQPFVDETRRTVNALTEGR